MSFAQLRIRRTLLPLSLSLVFLSVSPLLFSRARANTIPWQTDFEQAEALARQQRRPLWVQFHGPWCPKCRQMEATTFVSEPVIRLARAHFVSVAVQSDHRLDLVGRFGVSGLPATLILAPDGQVLVQHEGYVDPFTFAGWLQDVANRFPVMPEPSTGSPGLEGYCPVTLVQQGQLQAGLANLTSRYDGRLYRFADSESRDEFLKDPERYLPSNGGHCLVNQVDSAEVQPGDPRFGVYYKQRLYLCADEISRQRFAEDPERFAKADLADSGHCPHCRAISGVLVKGEPQFSLTHGDRRYLFPDAEHRDAFQSQPDWYLQ